MPQVYDFSVLEELRLRGCFSVTHQQYHFKDVHLTPNIMQDVLELASWRQRLINASAYCSRRYIDTKKIEYKGLSLQDVAKPDINVSILAIAEFYMWFCGNFEEVTSHIGSDGVQRKYDIYNALSPGCITIEVYMTNCTALDPLPASYGTVVVSGFTLNNSNITKIEYPVNSIYKSIPPLFYIDFRLKVFNTNLQISLGGAICVLDMHYNIVNSNVQILNPRGNILHYQFLNLPYSGPPNLLTTGRYSSKGILEKLENTIGKEDVTALISHNPFPSRMPNIKILNNFLQEIEAHLENSLYILLSDEVPVEKLSRINARIGESLGNSVFAGVVLLPFQEVRRSAAVTKAVNLIIDLKDSKFAYATSPDLNDFIILEHRTSQYTHRWMYAPSTFHAATEEDILADSNFQNLHDFLQNTLQLEEQDYQFICPDIELENNKTGTSFKLDFGGNEESVVKNYKPIVNSVRASLLSNITIPFNRIK